MIKLDLNKWVNFKKQFNSGSLIFTDEELECIEKLENKGNEIQNNLKKSVNDFEDYETYAKYILFNQSLLDYIISEMQNYKTEVIKYYEEDIKAKSKKRCFNRTVARLGA